jgi:pyridinium-3,5-biscarboxylic acid mononucleotide sulfurtransferase
MGSGGGGLRQAGMGLACSGAEDAIASRRSALWRCGVGFPEPRDGRLEQATAEAKHAALAGILRDCGSVCIGYSGGVDSVFLARAALDTLGTDRVLAVTGLSPAYPAVQREAAIRCAAEIGLPHLEVDTHELSSPGYVANATSRCFHCKDELWGRLAQVARERGIRTVVDGSNADDLTDHRPGARAAQLHGVRSPLQEAGLTKAEIRYLSQRSGLPTWDQPASPCLASRLAYGVPVTPTRLDQVERAEAALRARGLKEFRVRHHGDVARVEVSVREMDAAAPLVGQEVGFMLGLGFRRILLDVEGYRRGALNEGLVQLAGQ